MSERLTGLSPVIGRHARVLILGSMPGVRSLQQARYYAHPRNSFWFIMSNLTGVPEDADYRSRLRGIKRAGIALWDVVRACYREGSLDSDIDKNNIEINNLSKLIKANSRIRAVFFNGGTAEKLFRRHVAPCSILDQAGIHIERLPSTSPAHAAMSPEKKRQAWHLALQPWLIE